MTLNPGEFDPHIREFLHRHVRSVAALEMILLMHSHPQAEFSEEQLTQELRGTPTYTTDLLRELMASGLISNREESGRASYRLTPSSDSEREAITALVSLYTQRRMSVIDLIYQSPLDKIRTFAASFKIRK